MKSSPFNCLLDIPPIYKNHTQFIASLKSIQKNYDKFITSEKRIEEQIPITILNNLIQSVSISFTKNFNHNEIDLDDIFDGFIEEKLFLKASKWEDEMKNYILKECDKEIRRLKRVRDVERKTQMKIRMIDLNFLEDNFMAEKYSFHDEYLSCAYDFLNSDEELKICSSGNSIGEEDKNRRNTLNPQKFLQNRYLDFVKEFIQTNTKNHNLSMEEVITEFTKLIFDRIDYQIEVYKDRYIYAELYVMIRTGQIEMAINLVGEFKEFFQQYDPVFMKNFLRHLKGETPKFINFDNQQLKSLDRFKSFLIKLISNKYKETGDWIFSCIEDYLWFHFYSTNDLNEKIYKHKGNFRIHKDLINRFKGYSGNIQFLVRILCGDFKGASELLLKADFSICEIWFLIRKILKFNHGDDCKALMTDIIFIIAENFTSTPKRYKIIEFLKPILNDEYYEIVSNKIIDHKLFDIIGEDTMIPVCDLKMTQKIGEILKVRFDKKLIIRFHYVFNDDQFVVKVLSDYLIENIVNDEIMIKTNEIPSKKNKFGVSKNFDKIFNKVSSFYIGKEENEDYRFLEALSAINEFKSKGDIKSLLKTPFLNKETQYLLKRIPVIMEKMVGRVCQVLIGICDFNSAREVFELCVEFGLSEDVCRDICEKVGLLF
ncbi:hypothetical protein DMUE_4077 [Dictyocoela muelleri]|nr:hypothetical protein DMUE_4077 [Dictyocoela muelleri]